MASSKWLWALLGMWRTAYLSSQPGKLDTAPTVVSAGTVTDFVATDTISVAFPAGLADGDYALLLVASDGGPVASVDVGTFVLLNNSTQGTITNADVWGSPVNAADSSTTATVTLALAGTGHAVFLIYRGTSGLTPDFSATTHGTSVSITQPGVTSSAVGLAVVASFSSVAAASTPPGTWTEGLDAGTVYRLLEDHQAVSSGVIPAEARTQVIGDWVTFEGVLYPP